jgi:hypothetical protein
VDEAKRQFRKLAARFHPDRGGNENAFKKVKELFDEALRKLNADIWDIPGHAVFRSTDGRSFEFKYRVRRDFELGTAYIGNGAVAYSIDEPYVDLYEHGVSMLKSIKLPGKHKEQGVICLPEIRADLKLLNKRVLLLGKHAHSLCLRDVLNYYKGVVPSVHAAWMVSRMCNIRALLQYGADLAHGDLSPDSIYINPLEHTMTLVGGWWYACKLGQRIKALPPRTAALIGPTLGVRPVADTLLTGELVRATGRELLGDLYGSKLLMDKSLKPAMVHWLRSTATTSAFNDYAEWQDKILVSAFGQRKFHKLEITAKDVYAV